MFWLRISHVGSILVIAVASASHAHPVAAQQVPTLAIEVAVGPAPLSTKHGDEWFKQGARASRIGAAVAIRLRA